MQGDDVPQVIYKIVFGGLLLSPCCSVRVQNTTQQPPPQNLGSLGHGHACQRYGISREGKYLFSIPRSGTVLGWGVYISEHLCNTPSRKPPPGDDIYMINCGSFCILIRGGLLVDRFHIATREMVKIRRLGIELPMVTAIQMIGHTRWW